MITKYAQLENTEILGIKGSHDKAKTASLDKFADFEDYRTEDGYLYARIRAISSRVNKNHDGWPSVELAGSPEIFRHHQASEGFTVHADQSQEFGFSTFLGRPIFVDHNNSNPDRARGVIVDAKLHVEDPHKTAATDSYYANAPDNHMPPTWVELLLEVDAKSFPRLAKAIIEGSQDSTKGIDGFSMGADVTHTICNICKNKATNPDEYCNHVRLKGAHFDYIDPKSGRKTSKRAYEDCAGISFFEISCVFDPADETALIREVRHSKVKRSDFIEPIGPKKRCPHCNKGEFQLCHVDPPGPGPLPDTIYDDEGRERELCPYCDYPLDPEDFRAQKKPEYLQGQNPRNATKLTEDARDNLPSSAFVFPKERRYPIHDENHARAALSYASGTKDEAAVKAAVHKRYPNMGKEAVHRSKTAEAPLPQSMQETSPSAVDTLREERVCPVCFAPGAMVRTKQGYVPIETVEPGDYVLGENGRFNRVMRNIETEFNGLLHQIDIGPAVSPILVTSNHPIKTLVGEHRKRPARSYCAPGVCDKAATFEDRHKLAWVHASHLTDKNYLVPTVPIEYFDMSFVNIPERFLGKSRKGPSRIQLSDEFLWAIGLYLAEGNAGQREITFSLHRDETEYQERLRKLFESHGYGTRLELRDSKPNSAWVHVHSSTLSEWFPAWLGSGCAHKRIPAELFNLPNAKIECLRTGILDGDGCYRHDTFGQTSPILARQMIEIGHRLNLHRMPTTSVEYPIGKRPVYRIQNAVGNVTYGQKRQRRHGRNKWSFQGQTLHRIQNTQLVPYWGKVYNLSVENDPTYSVENILVHNCGSTMDEQQCEVCGYVEPPKGFDNPDLSQARNHSPEQTVESEPEFPDQAQALNNPALQQPPPKQPKIPPLSAGISNVMSWQPQIHPRVAGRINQVERPIVANPPPATDEPDERIVKDYDKPVTSRTAAEFIAAAGRKEKMKTADAAAGAPAAAKPDKNVDVTGVGGVLEGSNEEASKADKQVNVEDKGGTGEENVSADQENVNVDQGNEKSKNIEAIPTKTFDDGSSAVERQNDPVSDTPFPESDEGVKKSHDANPFPADDGGLAGGSPVEGVKPKDRSVQPSDRVNLLDPQTSPANNSGPTTQWTGTGGNGVLKQQAPVTPGAFVPSDQGVKASWVDVFKLADLEVELGLLESKNKYARIAELEKFSGSEVQSEFRALSRVKTAGLRKSAATARGGIGRVPSFKSSASEVPYEADDSELFL